VTPDEDILVHNCINEVLNGLARSQRVLSLLAQEGAIMALLHQWDEGPTNDLVHQEKGLLERVVRCVMGELDDDEFETRVLVLGSPKMLRLSLLPNLPEALRLSLGNVLP
jgi:hypothetical protein